MYQPINMSSWDESPLDHRSPLPLWFQIADRLRTAMDKDEFVLGDRLPSEPELARVLGVSRVTAKSALDRLARDGRVVRERGRGSIVQLPRVDQALNLLASFREDMQARGLEPSYRTRHVRQVTAPVEIRSLLGLPARARALSVERLLLANGKPLAFERAWLPLSVFGTAGPPSRRQLNTGSLYAYLERDAGVRMARAEEFIEAHVADGELAGQLGISVGEPVLCANRLCRDSSDRPVEYVQIAYRADRYRYRVELGRP